MPVSLVPFAVLSGRRTHLASIRSTLEQQRQSSRNEIAATSDGYDRVALRVRDAESAT